MILGHRLLLLENANAPRRFSFRVFRGAYSLFRIEFLQSGGALFLSEIVLPLFCFVAFLFNLEIVFGLFQDYFYSIGTKRPFGKRL